MSKYEEAATIIQQCNGLLERLRAVRRITNDTPQPLWRCEEAGEVLHSSRASPIYMNFSVEIFHQDLAGREMGNLLAVALNRANHQIIDAAISALQDTKTDAAREAADEINQIIEQGKK